MSKWLVQVFGERCGQAWEISVVREDNSHGRKSWGWFDESKLLVSDNGGPCRDPICGFVWDQQIIIAEELCRRLNAEEDISGGKNSRTNPEAKAA
jgi:hypothetical protein